MTNDFLSSSLQKPLLSVYVFDMAIGVWWLKSLAVNQTSLIQQSFKRQKTNPLPLI